MQTFLPYPDVRESLRCLDWQRLNKMRSESKQILNALVAKRYNVKWGYQKHAATCMWEGYENALAFYMNAAIEEWVKRGYKNNMRVIPIYRTIFFPPWFGRKDFHAAHRSNLLRKNFEFYKQYNWKEPSNLNYLWG